MDPTDCPDCGTKSFERHKDDCPRLKAHKIKFEKLEPNIEDREFLRLILEMNSLIVRALVLPKLIIEKSVEPTEIK